MSAATVRDTAEAAKRASRSLASLDEAKRSRGPYCVRQDARAEPTRDGLTVGSRVLGRTLGGNDAGDCVGDRRPEGLQIVGRTTEIETVGEVFVVEPQQRLNHRQAAAIDDSPSSVVGRER